MGSAVAAREWSPFLPRPRARPAVTVYGTGDRELAVVDRWAGGVGWQPHPDETLGRTSHALRTDAGLWVLDPLDAPGLDDLLAAYGDVAGVAVLSSWHARDAGVVARRHGVPVSVPAWVGRVPERVEAPVERFAGSLPGTDVAALRTDPLGLWSEGFLYRERDGTLYVPESLGTARTFLVGDERLGVTVFRRLFPPADALAGVAPERVLCGHGAGVFDDADRALRDALAGSRRRTPRMVRAHLGTSLRELAASAWR